MRARLPYHFCAGPGCTNMTSREVELCPVCASRLADQEFLPGAELYPADASQQEDQTIPTPGAVALSSEELLTT